MIPLRLTMLNGATKFRRVERFEHSDLCRAFELDQATYHFDLPKSAHAFDGSPSALSSIRNVSGYVMRGESTEPVGTVHVALEGERFRDLDPTNARDRLDLRQSNKN